MWGSMDESMHSLPTISQAGASVSDLSRPPQRGLSGGGQLFARMGKGPVREGTGQRYAGRAGGWPISSGRVSARMGRQCPTTP